MKNLEYHAGIVPDRLEFVRQKPLNFINSTYNRSLLLGLGRSFNSLIRTPFFAYSNHSTGLQLADLVCTVINRYYTERSASPRIPVFYSIVREMEWVASNPTPEGITLRGIKVIGG